MRPVGTTTAAVRPIGEKRMSKRIFSVESPCFYLFTVFPVLYLKWYIVKFSAPAIFHCFIRPRRSRATHPSVFNLLWQKISCSESGLMLWVISWSSDYAPILFFAFPVEHNFGWLMVGPHGQIPILSPGTHPLFHTISQSKNTPQNQDGCWEWPSPSDLALESRRHKTRPQSTHKFPPWHQRRTTSSTPFGRTCPPRKVQGWWRICWPHLLGNYLGGFTFTRKKGETKIYQEHLKFGLNQDSIPHFCWFNPPVFGAEIFPWPPCGRYI